MELTILFKNLIALLIFYSIKNGSLLLLVIILLFIIIMIVILKFVSLRKFKNKGNLIYLNLNEENLQTENQEKYKEQKNEKKIELSQQTNLNKF